MPCIVSASTRLPASALAAAAAVVCTSSSSSTTPRSRSSVASAARDRVVVFVTKRSRWPFSRSRAIASCIPGSASPETWRTPSTSRRMAAMADESIRVTRSVSIPIREIELRFSRSSGPGGQHAQRTETRVEAVFDVEASSALGPLQKRRVLARAGPVLRAVAQDDPSFRWRDDRMITLDRAQSVNAQIVRTTVYWSKIAPRRPATARNPNDAAYSFGDLDELVRNAELRGMQMMLTIWGTPGWANGGKGQNFAPRNYTDLTNFAYAVARRYS